MACVTAPACAPISIKPRTPRRFWIWWTPSSSASWRLSRSARKLLPVEDAPLQVILPRARGVPQSAFGLSPREIRLWAEGAVQNGLVEIRNGLLVLAQHLIR